MRARLDRGMANSAWLQLFPSAEIHHLVVASSDHMGVFLDTMGAEVVGSGGRRQRRMFRFEKAWLKEPGCEATIAEAWDVQPIGTAMYRVAEKIK